MVKPTPARSRIVANTLMEREALTEDTIPSTEPFSGSTGSFGSTLLDNSDPVE